jgi:thiol-disulfide isomerase/thioredoxin
MTPPLIALVLVGLVAFATAIGLLWRWQDGRGRSTDGRDILNAADLGAPLGFDATLVQFSSKICAPCRATHAVLDSVADGTGVRHVDLDIVAHEPLTRRFNILQTPTTLILDGQGVVRARIGGAVRYADVRARIVDLTPPRRTP